MRNFVAGLLIACLFSTAAMAADPAPSPPAAPPPPPLLPITLTPDDLTTLNNFLQQQPYSFASPILAMLTEKEQAARDAAKK